MIQGRPGRINYKGNLSRYMNPFDVSLVKILHILWYWSGKTLSTVASSMNCKSLRHFSSALFHLKSPQILSSRKIYTYVHVPFKSRPQETQNQPRYGVVSSYKYASEEAECLGALTCTHFHAQLHVPAPYSPTPLTHPVGRAGNQCCPAHSRKTCLKQSLLCFWALTLVFC